MKNITQIKKTLETFTLPPYHEIPDVGLYLEQVVRYINGYLTDFPEMKVTSSMISNYVKLKLVARVSKKTYSRDQIACLIFIAMAKTVLSMENIRNIMEMNQEESHEKAYSYYVNELEIALKNPDQLIPTTKNISSEKEEEIILNHIVYAITHQMYLQRYFAPEKEEQRSAKGTEKKKNSSTEVKAS